MPDVIFHVHAHKSKFAHVIIFSVVRNATRSPLGFTALRHSYSGLYPQTKVTVLKQGKQRLRRDPPTRQIHRSMRTTMSRLATENKSTTVGADNIHGTGMVFQYNARRGHDRHPNQTARTQHTTATNLNHRAGPRECARQRNNETHYYMGTTNALKAPIANNHHNTKERTWKHGAIPFAPLGMLPHMNADVLRCRQPCGIMCEMGQYLHR